MVKVQDLTMGCTIYLEGRLYLLTSPPRERIEKTRTVVELRLQDLHTDKSRVYCPRPDSNVEWAVIGIL